VKPELSKEDDLDIIEARKLLAFINEKKKAFLLITLLSLILGGVREVRRPTSYQAKLVAELPRDRAGQHIQDPETLSYIVKNEFNVTLKFARSFVLELTATGPDKKKIASQVSEAFLAVKARYNDLPTKNLSFRFPVKIKDIEVSKISKHKLRVVIRIVKVAFLGFLLCLLFLLSKKVIRKLKKSPLHLD